MRRAVSSRNRHAIFVPRDNVPFCAYRYSLRPSYTGTLFQGGEVLNVTSISRLVKEKTCYVKLECGEGEKIADICLIGSIVRDKFIGT